MQPTNAETEANPQAALSLALTLIDRHLRHLRRCQPDSDGERDRHIEQLVAGRAALVKLADQIDLIETEADAAAHRLIVEAEVRARREVIERRIARVVEARRLPFGKKGNGRVRDKASYP